MNTSLVVWGDCYLHRPVADRCLYLAQRQIL